VRSIVVECVVPTVPSRVDEVTSMARSIGYKVLETVVQHRKTIHHTYCIGPGKLEDVKLLVQENDIEAVVFANPLPGSQVFKIQKVLGGTDVKVVDRNMLILEVFDHRAMTKEAKLQIQLAKLRYTFSWGKEFLRLKGILGEQVGWSGPGDYPFREYQMAARKQISRIERELKGVYEKKNVLRARRRELGFPIVALAGYTQSGKTTFFNRVAGESKDTGLGPFTTLTTFARKVEYNGGLNFMLIDSIGFIEDMHPIIVKAFNTTLGEISAADLILLFVDVSEDEESMFRKVTASNYVLKRMALNVPLIICVNKVDRCSDDELKERKMLIQRVFAGVPQVDLSALKGTNVDRVLTLTHKQLNGSAPTGGERGSLELPG